MEAKVFKKPEVVVGKGGPTEAGWSAISTFMRCPKAYQFQTVRGILKPLAQTPDAYAIGILFHSMRARWFGLRFETGVRAWNSIKDAAREAVEENKLKMTLDAEQRALKLMQLYIDFWQTRPRPDPVVAEYKLGPAPLKPDDPFFLYRTARLDDVSRYPEAGGGLCIGEAKTTSVSVADVVNQYQLHGQTMLQALLWRMCPNGEKKYGKIAGIVLDAVVKPYERKAAQFGRVFVPMTDHMLDWFGRTMGHWLRAAAAIGPHDDAPRNPNGCTYLAGRMRVPCEYRELCQHGRSASNLYTFRDGTSLLTKADERPWE